MKCDTAEDGTELQKEFEGEIGKAHLGGTLKTLRKLELRACG